MLTKSLLLTISAFLVVQVSADSIVDAQAALNDFKQTSIDTLNEANTKLTLMLLELDSTALDTKEAALKVLSLLLNKEVGKVAADDLEACVNAQIEEGLQAVYDSSIGTTNLILQTIYDEEKQIIVCGRADAECLDGVTADIQEKIAAIPDMMTKDLEGQQATIDGQIELIKACAPASAKKALKMLVN